MKRIIALFLLISTILSLASCDMLGIDSLYFKGNKGKFDIFETKKIVLGKKVDSVELTTKSGEKITVDNTAEFYTIYDTVAFAYEDGKKYSFSAETTWYDESKSFVNMNIYHLADAEFYEFRTKKEEDDSVYFSEEYHYEKLVENSENVKYETKDYVIYEYEDNKAFGGRETGERHELYRSPLYTIMPDMSTDFGEMFNRSERLRNVVSYTYFFNPFEPGDDGYDFNEFVTREYTLYENYIVFKQTAPFLNHWNMPGADSEITYKQYMNSDCSITQEAYCNVKTGEIELIKVYGNSLWHIGEFLGKELVIDMQMYIHDVDEAEGQKKVDGLVNYIKTNSNEEE